MQSNQYVDYFFLQFYSKHVKEEHGKDLEEVEEKEWKPNFIIHAGRGRTPPPDYRVRPPMAIPNNRSGFTIERLPTLFSSQTGV